MSWQTLQQFHYIMPQEANPSLKTVPLLQASYPVRWMSDERHSILLLLTRKSCSKRLQKQIWNQIESTELQTNSNPSSLFRYHQCSVTGGAEESDIVFKKSAGREGRRKDRNILRWGRRRLGCRRPWRRREAGRRGRRRGRPSSARQIWSFGGSRACFGSGWARQTERIRYRPV